MTGPSGVDMDGGPDDLIRCAAACNPRLPSSSASGHPCVRRAASPRYSGKLSGKRCVICGLVLHAAHLYDLFLHLTNIFFMDWSVSSRFSSFNDSLSHATGQSVETARAAETAQSAPCAWPENSSSAMDVVIFWGGGQRREDLLAITGAASEAVLDYRIVEIFDSDFLSNSIKKELYCSGELGPHTQVIASFAVAEGTAAHTHYLSLTEDGGQLMPAADFLTWLRTPPGEPGSAPHAPWRGMVHAFWDRSGRLRDDYQMGRLAWNSGPTMSHACRKGGSGHNALAAMQDLCAYIGTVKGEAPYLEPEYIAARMLGVAGDTVACLGGRFKRALVVGAPRTSEQAQHDYLIKGLQSGNPRPSRIAGAGRDLRAVAGAMRHPAVHGAESKRQRSKVENVFMVRAERENLPAMEELRGAHPSLRAMTDHRGRSGEQVYLRVSNSVTIRREMAVLSAGQGTQETCYVFWRISR